MDKCHCWSQSSGVQKLPKFETMSNCSFVQHAQCVAQITSQFKPIKSCHCPRKCLQDELIIGHIQYGKYQGDKFISRTKMLTSVMMYLKPEHKTLQLEHVEYEATQFFSDVGGAVGLILGISCTTVFGIIGLFEYLLIGLLFESSEYLTTQTLTELYLKWKRCQYRRRHLCHTATQIDLSNLIQSK